MKILMLLSRLDQTGMTTHTIDLAEALVKKGHRVKVLVGYRKNADAVADGLMEKLLKTGVEIKTFSSPNSQSKLKMLWSGLSLVIKTLLWRDGVIHVQSPYLSWVPALLGRQFVSTLHVADLRKCWYYKNATHLIAISKETKEYAKHLFGYKDEEITIVNHGVSSEFASTMTSAEVVSARQALNLPSEKLLLTIVGSIERRKGHDILLQAVEKLPKECRDKVHIVFLGSDKTADKSNSRWLEQAIRSSRTADIVSHFEYQDSKLFYAISDVFLLPSWLEGFGLVVIEAMMAGNLCIRSDAEGAFEQIIDGETGYIFPKGDVARLTEILRKVILNDELRTSIAKKGRDFALTHFTADIMAENTTRVYKMIENNNE